MFDRVVAALITVVLMLFSASAALACRECSCETVQCLASLELQAEEVLSTDLEAVSNIDLNEQVENENAVAYNLSRAQNEWYNLIGLATSDAMQEAVACGAAGVVFTRGYQSNDDTYLARNQHDTASARNLGVGGAGA